MAAGGVYLPDWVLSLLLKFPLQLQEKRVLALCLADCGSQGGVEDTGKNNRGSFCNSEITLYAVKSPFYSKEESKYEFTREVMKQLLPYTLAL